MAKICEEVEFLYQSFPEFRCDIPPDWAAAGIIVDSILTYTWPIFPNSTAASGVRCGAIRTTPPLRPLCQHAAPDATRAVGPVARLEARPSLGRQPHAAASSRTRQPGQPGIEPISRETPSTPRAARVNSRAGLPARSRSFASAKAGRRPMCARGRCARRRSPTRPRWPRSCGGADARLTP